MSQIRVVKKFREGRKKHKTHQQETNLWLGGLMDDELILNKCHSDIFFVLFGEHYLTPAPLFVFFGEKANFLSKSAVWNKK